VHASLGGAATLRERARGGRHGSLLSLQQIEARVEGGETIESRNSLQPAAFVPVMKKIFPDDAEIQALSAEPFVMEHRGR
jgi:hypothetical protein